MAEVTIWQRFAHDPRSPQHAELRAAHADRDIILEALTAAYADGRLDPDEFDERVDAAHAARTLGELPALLADLVPSSSASRALATPEAVQARAVEKWQEARREAFAAFLIPSLICWTIWWVVMPGGFLWPLFVSIPGALNLIATLARRQEIIASEVRRIERRAEKEQAKALRKKEAQRELEAGQPTPDTAEDTGTGS